MLPRLAALNETRKSRAGQALLRFIAARLPNPRERSAPLSPVGRICNPSFVGQGPITNPSHGKHSVSANDMIPPGRAITEEEWIAASQACGGAEPEGGMEQGL